MASGKAKGIKFSRSRSKGNKGKIKGFTYSNSLLNRGDYGLKAIESGMLSEKLISAMQLLLKRSVSKNHFKIINVVANRAICKKPTNARMGNGKAPFDHFASKVYKGTILFELAGMLEEEAKSICKKVAYRIGFETKFVRREGYE